MIDWSTALNSLASAIVGGGITLVAGERTFRRDRTAKQHIASMQIAVQLRTWLIDTVRAFEEEPVFAQPDPNDDGGPYGYSFPRPADIPAFPFTANLERASELKSKLAESVFALIEKRANADRDAYVTAELIDYETASTGFELSIAKVWLDAHATYQLLAAEVAWNTDVVTAAQFADMQTRANPPPPAEAAAPQDQLELP